MVQAVIGEWPAEILATAQVLADELVQQLSDAAPVGEGEPRGGMGRLNESFTADALVSSEEVVITTSTSEEYKLLLVTQGYAGIITPVVKKALWWPEAMHPVSWVRGQEANDFVSPVTDAFSTYAQDTLTAALINLMDQF